MDDLDDNQLASQHLFVYGGTKGCTKGSTKERRYHENKHVSPKWTQLKKVGLI